VRSSASETRQPCASSPAVPLSALGSRRCDADRNRTATLPRVDRKSPRMVRPYSDQDRETTFHAASTAPRGTRRREAHRARGWVPELSMAEVDEPFEGPSKVRLVAPGQGGRPFSGASTDRGSALTPDDPSPLPTREGVMTRGLLWCGSHQRGQSVGSFCAHLALTSVTRDGRGARPRTGALRARSLRGSGPVPALPLARWLRASPIDPRWFRSLSSHSARLPAEGCDDLRDEPRSSPP
jgi:hypothetical protein